MCVCVCVPCLGDYQWLGVWCVRLGDCFWVSLCVCLSVYVFVIMCVCIYSFSTCVNDKCVFCVASQRQVSASPSACVCLCVSLCFPAGLGHISFSVSRCVCLYLCSRRCYLSLYVSTGHQNSSSPNIDTCLERCLWNVLVS